MMFDPGFRPEVVRRCDRRSGKDALQIIHDAMMRDELLEGKFRDNHAMISFVESERHFWSPWLHIATRVLEEGGGEKVETGCEVRGRFSPHPGIWTGFMFSWLGLGVLFFFSIIVAVSQQISGTVAWAWWLLPVWCVCGLGLWVVSRLGQRLAHDEMERMMTLFEPLGRD